MKFLTHDGLLYFWKKVKSYIDTGLNSKQNNLGYTPVQNGTGIGQTVSNQVKIGWSAESRLKATVDGTNLGNIVFDGNLPTSLPANGGNADYATNANYANSAGSATSATNATNATNANYATSAGNANTVGGYSVSKGVVAGQYGVRVAQISNADIGVGAALSTGELYIVYE